MKDKLPLISIVTPSYNQGKYIEETIKSVLNQNYPNFEHIIIDNQSTDSTIAILKKYPHLRWISEPDNGLYDAMNKGIKMAKGDIIGIINTDDWYADNIFEKVAGIFIENPDVGVIHGDMLLWKDGKEIGLSRYKDYQKYYCMWVKHPTCFVSKNAYEKYGVFNIKYKIQADYDLMLRFKNAGVKFHYIPRVISNFRIGGLSTSNWSFKESIEVRIKNGMSLPWAVISAITVRSIFRTRLIIKEFLNIE